MTNQHPITPPPELVQQWINEEDGLTAGHIATQAARWGAALAEQPVGQSRRCIYNPVQIAECGGPCEQIGPEACDCGALWVDQDTEQPVKPTDKELCETYRTAYYAEENRQGPHCMAAGLRAVLARWGQP